MTRTFPLILKKRRFWASVLLAQFFLFFLLSKSNAAIALCSWLFEQKKYVHQFLASKVPFSLGDVFYVALSLLLIYFAFNLLSAQRRTKSGFHLLLILNAFYFIYQMFWGMLYFQEPLLRKLSSEEISIAEAKKLSEVYLSKCIEDREKVNENKNGIFILENLKEIKIDLIENQSKLPEQVIEKDPVEIIAIKPSIFHVVMSYTGILGYYNPFTSEAQYNAALPATLLPSTLAHESSHQLGFAREEEASFVGFLIGKNSRNTAVKYASDLFALKSLLNYIGTEDPVFVETTVEKFSPGMKRDLKAEKIFREKHEGILNQIFALTNHLFLQSNQQEGSITYSYFTELLIKYERDIP